jgi:hypothetical protein
MHSRFLNRLEQLEALISPKPQGRVFVLTIESQSPLSQAEQLSTFRATNGVGPHDHLVVITFN